MTPRGRAQVHRVVKGHAGEVVTIVGELIPLLAGYFTSLAADADRCVGEESVGHIKFDRPALKRARERDASLWADGAQ